MSEPNSNVEGTHVTEPDHKRAHRVTDEPKPNDEVPRNGYTFVEPNHAQSHHTKPHHAESNNTRAHDVWSDHVRSHDGRTHHMWPDDCFAVTITDFARTHQ